MDWGLSFWISRPSCLKSELSFACQVKLSCNRAVTLVLHFKALLWWDRTEEITHSPNKLNAICISMWSHLGGKKIQGYRVVVPIRVGFLYFRPVKTRELESVLHLLLNIYNVLKWSIPCHISKQGCHNHQWFHVNFWAQGYPVRTMPAIWQP